MKLTLKGPQRVCPRHKTQTAQCASLSLLLLSAQIDAL